MPNVIDSYSETNVDSYAPLHSASNHGFGQCFTADGEKIVDSRWYLRRHTSPTGNAVSKIYTMTGTFGINGNVGTLLATSDNVDVSTIGTTAALVTFNFSGANQYVTTNGAHYVVTIEYAGGDGSNYIEMGYDGSSATHPGTWTFNTGGPWTATDAGIDLCFYVDGVSVDVTVNLTGVAASPAVGAGTVEISGEAPITHATEPIRIRQPRKPKPVKIEPEPAPNVVVKGKGAAAGVIIGVTRFDAAAPVLALRYDETLLNPFALIDSTFAFEAAPIGFVMLGKGMVQAGIELYPEEIAALLELL